jgi:hypothetical protein
MGQPKYRFAGREAFLILNLTGGAHRSGHLSHPNRYATDGSRSNGSQASSTSARVGAHRRLQRRVFDSRGSMERKQGSSTMTQNGGGSSTPPPGTGGVSNGGRTRWRHPRPVAHRQSWLHQTEENWGKRRCLGGCWSWCGFNCVIGGGFYRPGGRG